jgi:hypothetical protein
MYGFVKVYQGPQYLQFNFYLHHSSGKILPFFPKTAPAANPGQPGSAVGAAGIGTFQERSALNHF